MYLYEQFILQSGVHLIGNNIFTILLSSFFDMLSLGDSSMWKIMKNHFVCLTVNLEFMFIKCTHRIYPAKSQALIILTISFNFVVLKPKRGLVYLTDAYRHRLANFVPKIIYVICPGPVLLCYIRFSWYLLIKHCWCNWPVNSWTLFSEWNCLWRNYIDLFVFVNTLTWFIRLGVQNLLIST